MKAEFLPNLRKLAAAAAARGKSAATAAADSGNRLKAAVTALIKRCSIMDPRKHRRMEDEWTLITKSMKGSIYGLFPGMLWGLLAAEQMNFPGLIQTMKITGRKGFICAGTGALFAGVEHLLEKNRKKRDIVDGIGGAFVAGAAFSGLRNRSISMAITGGITFAITAVFIDGVLPANLRSQSGSNLDMLTPPRKDDAN